jgi:hypothetical protein
MKRHGYLWDGMISFENLLRAAEAARRGKRFRPAAARFFFHLSQGVEVGCTFPPLQSGMLLPLPTYEGGYRGFPGRALSHRQSL